MASSKGDEVMIVVHLVELGLRGSADWSGKLYALELISTGACRRALLRTSLMATKYRALFLRDQGRKAIYECSL